ncbi:MAG: acyl-CoA dehydrogenase, partial [Alphaproteobacteria bacterium]
MAYSFQFDSITLPPEAERLRLEVRAFLRDEIEAGTFVPGSGDMDSKFNPSFSRKVAAKGWIGM